MIVTTMHVKTKQIVTLTLVNHVSNSFSFIAGGISIAGAFGRGRRSYRGKRGM